jgi:hypothetical protein
VAVKVAVVEPAATVTGDEAVTLELLPVITTLAPPAGAAVLSVTVQVEEPAAVNEAGVQVSEDGAGSGGGGATPPTGVFKSA